MNIIDIQDQLKNFSEQQLISEMQTPTGSAPQFLVLSEIKRRKRVRDDFMKREAANQPTVAEEAVAAAGVPQSSIMGMSEAMAPKSTMVQNSVGSVMPQSMRPQTMPAPTDDAIPMRSGGLAQFGQELSQKVSSDTVEPFLDEVESMASDRFGVDLGDGPMQQRMPFEGLRGGLGSLLGGRRNDSRYRPAVMDRAYRGGGKGGAVTSPLPFPTQRVMYAEGGVVRAANGLPLGLRQNNPGNIRPGAGFYGETGQGGGYATFGSEDEGLRAIARLLGTYDDKYGINTLRGLTSRYAPRSDNKLSYDNYLSYLSNTLDLDPDEEFDLKGRRGDLIPAIIGFEQGREYEGRYSDDQIARAIRAAGTEDEAEIAEILAGGSRNALFGVTPREVSTVAAAPSVLPNQKGITALPVEDTSDGTPSEAEIRARVDQMKRDAGLGEYKTIVPNLGGSGVVIQDIGDAARAAEKNAQTAQSQVITSAEQGVAPAQLADLADDAGDAIEKAAIVQAQQKDIQANNAVEAAKTKIREAEAAKTKEEELRKIAETAPPSVAAGLLREADELAAKAAQLTEQAGQDNTEGAALEAAATEQRESKQPNPGTIAPETESSEVERGEGDDETATDSDSNVTYSTQRGGTTSSLEQEILDLQRKMEKDRESDKYLALAQAGLALMSSKEPTLLGAIGEAGVSGLSAYREAQDRYNEGVVDLINARSKLAKGSDKDAFDAGNAVTRLGQIERALGGADGMTLADEDRARLLQERLFLQRFIGIPELTTGATSAAPAS
jgi:hypothetical protein